LSNPTLSIVIPARNEQFLTPTIKDLLRNARGEVEVIVVLEAYWPDETVDDPRVHYVHSGTPRGMRGAINAGMAVAKGEYVMKCDAHCAFSEGYDVARRTVTKYRKELKIPTARLRRQYGTESDS